jgi:hypothetical protein
MRRILHWLTRFIAVFKRPGLRSAASHVPGALAEETPAAPNTATAAGAVDKKVDHDDTASAIILTAPDQHEVKRRRDLVRALFNEFWRDRVDKPASFVDRLDEAESYLNERLAASGESWLLDAGTRDMLGLPARSTAGLRSMGRGDIRRDARTR